MHVSLDTLRRAAQLLDSLSDADQPAVTRELLMSGLAELVGCDVVTYNEIGAGPDQLSYYADYPPGSLDPDGVKVFEAYLHEHPLLIHYRLTGSTDPVRISDFLTRERFRRLGLYSEFYRHIPVEDQIAFTLPPAADDQIIAIALNRADQDFTDADRDVLSALSVPLSNSLARARRRDRAQALITTTTPDGLGGLTDRESQVLQLAAQGRTNRAIAHAIGVSPRTIAKHLEHIYRKLGVTGRAAAVYRTASPPSAREAPLPTRPPPAPPVPAPPLAARAPGQAILDAGGCPHSPKRPNSRMVGLLALMGQCPGARSRAGGGRAGSPRPRPWPRRRRRPWPPRPDGGRRCRT
jgi:DNA-binding CsgD family transcriptional regulator